MLDRGESPTVATAAEEALVSRTTAYRYFPTQESLLLELSLSLSASEIDELLSAPGDDLSPQERLLELVEIFNRYIGANEMISRTAQRHYLDTWLAAERAGTVHHQLRRGRRLEWISTVLAPIRDRMDEADYRRIEAALCLTIGGEAFLVLRDVCQLDTDEAVAVSRWAAATLLAAALEQSSDGANVQRSPQKKRKSNTPTV